MSGGGDVVVVPPQPIDVTMPSLHQPAALSAEAVVPSSTKSSKYKGVHWDKTKTKWVGYIHMKGKKHHLGYFGSEEEAARAYDRESIRCRGVAKNFPRTDYPAQELAQEPETRKALEKSSRYTGVSWNKLRRKWAARIIVEGKSQHLGHYASETEAARAYDRVCYQSRGSTKNFPVEEYLEFMVPSAQKVMQGQQPGVQQMQHMLPAGAGLIDLASMQQGQHHVHTLFAHGHYAECGSHASGPEEHSQDSTTCAETLKHTMDGHPRTLLLQGQHIMPDGKTLAATQPPLGANPPFNLYTTLSSPGMVQTSMPFQTTAYQHLGNPVGSYQQVVQPNWAQQPATSAPHQLMGYSTSLPGGLAGFLPMGAVKPEPTLPVPQNAPQGNVGNPLMLPPQPQQQVQQTTTPGQPVHGSNPYTFITSQGQTVIPASFLAASSLQLPGMPSNVTQLAPGGQQLTAQNVAQLQALMMAQNCNTAMFSPQQPGIVPNAFYASEKFMAADPQTQNLQKRQRLDSGAAT